MQQALTASPCLVSVRHCYLMLINAGGLAVPQGGALLRGEAPLCHPPDSCDCAVCASTQAASQQVKVRLQNPLPGLVVFASPPVSKMRCIASRSLPSHPFRGVWSSTLVIAAALALATLQPAGDECS
jgi:hypothetical protein